MPLGVSPIILILGAALGSIALFGNYVALIMVGKVNEKVAESERISYVWWSRNVLHRYRQLYPDGKLGTLLRAAEISLVVGFAILAYFILR